jgi:hypothetical protein
MLSGHVIPREFPKMHFSNVNMGKITLVLLCIFLSHLKHVLIKRSHSKWPISSVKWICTGYPVHIRCDMCRVPCAYQRPFVYHTCTRYLTMPVYIYPMFSICFIDIYEFSIWYKLVVNFHDLRTVRLAKERMFTYVTVSSQHSDSKLLLI